MYSNGLIDHLCPRTNGDPPTRALHTAQEICDCKWFNRPKYFNGTLDAMAKISRVEGVSSLWSGLSPTLVLAIPTTVTYFTMYEQLKVMLSELRQSSPSSAQSPAPSWVSLTAGGLARLVAVTLLRDVPFSALYWPLYESTRDTLRRWAAIRERRSLYTLTVQENNFLINFMSGALAGSVASTITLPFDVIKTIKQIEMGEKIMKVPAVGQPRTNINIAKELVSDQGVRSLFSGLIPRLLKVAPACAIMISSYEYCKDFFGKQNKNIS